MMDSQDIAAWLRLKLTPGVGEVTLRRLLQVWGSPGAVFEQTHAALRDVVGPAVALRLLQCPPEWATVSRQTQDWLAAACVFERRLLAWGDPAYPQELLQIADPPCLLFTEGRVQALNNACKLAVVGTRQPSGVGRAWAYRAGQDLARAGCVVVSGLALGIDAAAHQGALAGGGLTWAVLGTGLDRVYPGQHRELAEQIRSQGMLWSECLLGTRPLAHHFPRRNRIIAGLSRGVVVVEAALASGSLITAQQALEQGREVFAVPGSVASPQSRGCHALIRQGASLVESATDILQDLAHPGAEVGVAMPPGPQAGTDPLWVALGPTPCDLDTLQARLDWPTSALQTRLFELELEGWVGRLPGGWYQRQPPG